MSSADLDFVRFEYLLSLRGQHADEIAAFLAAVAASSRPRARKLPRGRMLFRAQLGYVMRADDKTGVETPDAFLPERMKPPRESPSEGRVNRKGQPCLYLATDSKTALAEVRPWRGAHISLGHFKVMEDCALIDFSTDKVRSVDLMLREEPVSTEEKAAAVWGDIAYAFAKPLTRNDDLNEYFATQAIAEKFREQGYDGVAYQSTLGKGKCIALFDLGAAELASCALFETEAVAHTFAQINNWYCIPKHHPEVASSIGIDVSSRKAAEPHFLTIEFLPAEESNGGPRPEQERAQEPHLRPHVFSTAYKG